MVAGFAFSNVTAYDNFMFAGARELPIMVIKAENKIGEVSFRFSCVFSVEQENLCGCLHVGASVLPFNYVVGKYMYSRSALRATCIFFSVFFYFISML